MKSVTHKTWMDKEKSLFYIVITLNKLSLLTVGHLSISESVWRGVNGSVLYTYTNTLAHCPLGSETKKGFYHQS